MPADYDKLVTELTAQPWTPERQNRLQQMSERSRDLAEQAAADLRRNLARKKAADELQKNQNRIP